MNKDLFISIAAVCVLAIACSRAISQPVYNANPDWISSDTPVSTGGAFVDLDRDGWLDFVVSNGNDMRCQRVAVYYNRGDGTFPATPDWQSDNIAYHGHLAVADVNGDGWPDVAVAHLGEYNTVGSIARVYLNNGGTLSSQPDWTSDIDGNAFGVAFGDVNNDGRPDLAVATGWAYNPQHFYHNYVYLNVDGALEPTASWESDDTHHYQGALWVDADDDGWLDLVGIGSNIQTRIYRNLGGVLETTASWQTAEGTDQDGIMLTAGDVQADGLLDLFATDNTQLGGSGRFKQYDGLAEGMFETTYSWSYYEGYGSAIALADLDADGFLDLATGAWWDHTRIFINNGQGFDTPDWSSQRTSVIEKIVFGDIDRLCLHNSVAVLKGDGERRLFYLPDQQIQSVSTVKRDGRPLLPSEFTLDREHGWITVADAPQDTLEVAYAYSTSLDMGITNWDNSVGNFLYYNQLNNRCCNGKEVIKRAKCKTRGGKVKKVIVVVKKATPGGEYTATLDTGEKVREAASGKGKVKFKFSGNNAPPCGPNGVSVCDEYREFGCDC